jgi:multidrug transporter EmrE-like cation transporter
LVLFIALLLLAIIENVVYYLIKSYYLLPDDNKNYGYRVGAFLVYGCISEVILFVFNYSDVDSVGWFNAMWNVFSTVYILLQGYIVFSETLSTVQIVGVVVGFLSMLLLNWDGTISKWF